MVRSPRPELSRFDVVIPAYRSAGTLPRTLASLIQGNRDAIARIVVVASADADGEHAAAARPFSGVHVVQSAERLSAGEARNAGRREHGESCEALLFLDADCELPAGGAAALMSELNASAGADFVCASVLPSDGRVMSWVRHALEFKDFEPGAPKARFAASAAMAVRGPSFDRAGGFPDLYPGEDLVLSARAKELGMTVGRSDAVVVLHAHPRGFSAFTRHQWRLGATARRARELAPVGGAAFARHRWLAPLLFTGRALRAGRWAVSKTPGFAGVSILVAPLYLWGLAAWTIGFVLGTSSTWSVTGYADGEPARAASESGCRLEP